MLEIIFIIAGALVIFLFALGVQLLACGAFGACGF
jgi:hypothetical protein